jgi:hypothetical protein
MTLTNASKTIVVAGANATTQSSNPVFPFASGWSIYAGKCAGNNPSTYSNNPWPSLPNSTFIPARGTTIGNGKAYMRVLTLNLGDSLNGTGTNSTLDYVIKPWSDATYTYMAGCGEGVTGSVPVTGGASQPVTVALPYGLYSICVQNRNTNYGQTNATKANGYRYKTFASTSGSPASAFHATPKRTGIALKGGVPTPDNSTQTISLDSGTYASAPVC